MAEDEIDELEEGYEHCPVCNRVNCPGAMDHCEHYVGSYWDGQVIWSDRFQAFEQAWGELQDLVDDELGEDGLDRCRALAAKRRVGEEWFSDGVWHVGASGALMQLMDFEEGPYVETEGMLSGSGYSLYLPIKDALEELVKSIEEFIAAARGANAS
jgi:hypothetical protein